MPLKPAVAILKQPQARAVFCEQLAQLEASLEETRGRVLNALDEELASIRQWMESLQSLDPALSIYRPEPASPDGAVASQTEAPKTSKPGNIVHLTPQDFAETELPRLEEPLSTRPLRKPPWTN